MPNTTQFDRHKIEYNVIPKVLPESLSSLAWSAVREVEDERRSGRSKEVSTADFSV